MHKIKKLKITADFTTTVEITGNSNTGKVIFFSHGFGLKRDSRGMFIDIENEFKGEFLCVRFDYNDVSQNGDMLVKPYSFMVSTLLKVISFVEKNYDVNEKTLIAHSMGGVIAAMAKPVGFKSIMLLASPESSPYTDFLNHFEKRVGTSVNLDGITVVERSDGTKTTIEKEFFDEMRDLVPVEYYKELVSITDLVFIKPSDDLVISDLYDETKAIEGITFIEIGGGHDFRGEARGGLIGVLKENVI